MEVVTHIDNVFQSNNDAQVHNKYEPIYTDLRFDTLLRGDGAFRDDTFCACGGLVSFLATGNSDSLTIIKSGL